MPCPVSLTVSRTYVPGVIGGLLFASESSTTTFCVRTVSFPPSGIASRAFTARFMITCSIWPGSALTGLTWGPGKKENSMCSPIRRGSIFPMSEMTTFRSSKRGCKTCMRLNASNWRVMDAARLDAFCICSALRRCIGSPGSYSSKSSAFPRITVNRLLKSCATPPARRPTASILCACRSRCSSSWRSSSVFFKLARMRSNALVTSATSSPPFVSSGYAKSPRSSARTPETRLLSGRVKVWEIRKIKTLPAKTLSNPSPSST